MRRIKPNAKRMRAALTAGMFATDLVDHLTAKGMSFREAHGVVGMAVSLAERKRKGLDELTEKELESIAAVGFLTTSGRGTNSRRGPTLRAGPRRDT